MLINKESFTVCERLIKTYLFKLMGCTLLPFLTLMLDVSLVCAEEDESINVPVEKFNEKESGIGVSGEHINVRDGSLYWEINDITVPGTAGHDILINRSLDKSFSEAHKGFSNWEIEVPRLELNTFPEGRDTLNFCESPSSLYVNVFHEQVCSYQNVPKYECWFVYQDGVGSTECGYVNSYENVCEMVPRVESYEYFKGLNLILPGQAPKPMFINLSSTSNLPSEAKYATEDNWLGRCEKKTDGSGDDIFIISSPEGHVYRMDTFGITKRVGNSGYDYFEIPLLGSEVTIYASEVADRYGNKINYDFDHHTIEVGLSNFVVSKPILHNITSNDGRIVAINYKGEGDYIIDEILVNGSKWKYHYSADGKYLEEVVLPDNGGKWKYINYGPEHERIKWGHNNFEAEKNKRRISTVTTPTGLVVSYGYDDTLAGDFFAKDGLFHEDSKSTVLNYRTQIGTGVPSNTVYFSYTKDENAHFTSLRGDIRDNYVFSRDDTLFGLIELYRKRHFDGSVAETIDYEWLKSNKLGSSNIRSNDERYAIYRRMLEKKIITRGKVKSSPIDILYPEYSKSKFAMVVRAFNKYGYPEQVYENGVGAERFTEYDYFSSDLYGATSIWLPNLIENERVGYSLDGQAVDQSKVMGWIERTLNNYGQVKAINENGIPRSFEYYSDGNLKNETYWHEDGGESIQINYNNYYLGIPQNESHPEGVAISRVVDSWGRIISETNGEGHTTTTTYDALGRKVRLNKSGLEPIFYDWLSSTSVNTTQGNFRKNINFSSLNEELNVTEYDSSSPGDIIQSEKEYDKFGQLIYSSRRYSLGAENKIKSSGNYGTAYEYDVLGRLTRKWDTSMPDEVTSFYYGTDWDAVRDENDPFLGVGTMGYGMIDGRGYKKVFELNAYSDPDKPVVVAIQDQVKKTDESEASYFINTQIEYDVLGNLKSLSQGGYTRTYEYYTDKPKHLKNEYNPETGFTHYDYDMSGNMISKDIGGNNAIRNTYDELNRLIFVDFPDGAPDVSRVYDKTDNLKEIDNGVSRWEYAYTDIGELKFEKLSIDDQVMSVDYDYDQLGHRQSITYPNGDKIDLLPNIWGYPTKVGSFASDVKYYANGLLESYLLGNGHLITFGLNTQGFPSNIKSKDKSGKIHLDRSYTYDSRGNINNIIDSLGVSSVQIELDGISRVISATSELWGGEGTVTYDDVGNILTKNFGVNQTYTYDSNNRLKTISGGYNFSYDVFGNVESTGFNIYNFDSSGSLKSLYSTPSVEYIYDGHNRRVSTNKTNGSQYISNYSMYDSKGSLIYRFDKENENSTNYIYIGNRLLATNLDCSNNDIDGDKIPDCVEDEWGLNKYDSKDAMSDMDNDGVANIYEYAFGLNPKASKSGAGVINDIDKITANLGGVYDADMDGDGLSDIDEFNLGANPLNADTDGDGKLDGVDSNPTFNEALLIPILFNLMN